MHGFHVLVRLFCTRNIKDTQCGFKLFKKSAAELIFPALHLNGWAFDIEVIYLAESLGIGIVEVNYMF
jgi:dolichyl-phosphate beta-glucosyltransferase